MRVGIIGVGTIGGFLAERIEKDSSLELCFVLDIDKSKVEHFSKEIVLGSIEEMSEKKPDLVVEAASHQAVEQYAESVLKKTNFLILSVGALADRNVEENIENLCKKHSTKLFVPSGALAGIDMLKAMQSELKEVEIVSRKNPKGFGREDKKLEILFASRSKKEIFLRADRIISYGNVMIVMDLIRSSGIKKISMVTEPPQRKKSRN